LEVLKWLRSQDPSCPCIQETFIAAQENGNLEVFEWLCSDEHLLICNDDENDIVACIYAYRSD
jgi:hypothetical protein